MTDFEALALAPVYSAFGTAAALTIGSRGYELIVIDETRGVTVEDGSLVGDQTIRPAVDLRRSTLAELGVANDDLVGAQIALNEVSWRIESLLDNGKELRLILLQED